VHEPEIRDQAGEEVQEKPASGRLEGAVFFIDRARFDQR
jgi:hypothetical protein